MSLSRRDYLRLAGFGTASMAAAPLGGVARAQEPARTGRTVQRDLTITAVRVTPIALPDPPILAASGCHGPYFLRTIVEIETADGVTGIGETHGGEGTVADLRRAARSLVGQSVLAYRSFVERVLGDSPRVYAGVELACLDAIGRATGLRLCDLLGGPVRDEVEFAAYLFFRYAADHPALLADKRIVDARGKNDRALDPWGEVRTPEAMAELAWQFHERFGFRVHKLKAGVLSPEVELDALRAISSRFGGKHQVRIDPNGRWSVETATKIGRELRRLPLEYYEDPVRGQEAMAEVRRRTDLPMSTNMCVIEMDDIPAAVRNQPVDVVLADHHYWGGFAGCLALGQIASAMKWRLSQHSNNHAGVTMAAMIHLAATIPALTIASDTHYPWLVDSAEIIAGGKLQIAGGKLQIPAGPGLGVQLDRDRLARAHETYNKCGMRDRDDAFTMRIVEPGWERTLW
jgi:glucarate dehydratase